MALSAAVPSTPMEFVSRLTEQDVTPGTLETAFSTRALHAAQLMPVTLNCFIYFLLLGSELLGFGIALPVFGKLRGNAAYFISFCSVATSSSVASSLPSRMSWATQVRM